METRVGQITDNRGNFTVYRPFSSENRGLSPVVLRLNFLSWLALLAVVCSFTACASGARVVDHSFGFDTRSAIPRVEVLDYRYGDSKLPGVRPPEWALKEGKIGQATGVNGPMLVGDSLYVKWRIKDTGQVYEDTVDLRHRLPTDIKDHKVYFIIEGSQLYVYLISPEKLEPNPCMLKGDPRALARATNKADDIIYALYCFRKIIKLYPDQPKH